MQRTFWRDDRFAICLLGLGMFLIYWLSGIDEVSLPEFADYPFGADVPTYNNYNGYDFHPLSLVMSRAFGWVVTALGVEDFALTRKLPFAVLGAGCCMVAALTFRALMGERYRIHALVGGACFGLSLIVWFYGRTPESYMLTTLLYSGYLYVVVLIAQHGVTLARGSIGSIAAVVFLLAVANDITAFILLTAPVLLFGVRLFKEEGLRRIVIYHVVLVTPYVLMHLAFDHRFMWYFGLVTEYAPAAGMVSTHSDGVVHSVFTPVVQFFFHSVVAPASETTHAPWTEYPTYQGYFTPSLIEYFSRPLSVAALALYVSLFLFWRPARMSRLLWALLAVVGARFVFAAAFNPQEAILYSSVAIMPLFAVLFANLAQSRFRYGLALMATFAVSLAAANAGFLV